MFKRVESGRVIMGGMTLHIDRKHIHVGDDGMIVVEVYEGQTENMRKAVNVKEWYESMNDLFLHNHVVKFADMLGESKKIKKGKFFDNQALKGEHVDPGDYMNRQPNMYEKKFWTVQSNAGTRELEIEWQARAPMNTGKLGYSGYGWVEIKIDVQVRDIKDKEILVNNKKVVLQEGKWEFRNTFIYKNNIISEVINKMPIIRSSDMLKEMVVKYFFLEDIERDVELAKEVIKPLVYEHLRKYFA